ncbi:hypothetical protein [Paenibacillus sp. FSL K6-0108]|uniref:hypothetical protein n=1 Tax=Paenibacillus sp. FSL K6-0108 TaxID=2921417 RepID=UPI00324CCDB5
MIDYSDLKLIDSYEYDITPNEKGEMMIVFKVIEAINERDQAMAEMTKINANIVADHERTKRKLEWFENRCLEFMKEKAAWETQEEPA